MPPPPKLNWKWISAVATVFAAGVWIANRTPRPAEHFTGSDSGQAKSSPHGNTPLPSATVGSGSPSRQVNPRPQPQAARANPDTEEECAEFLVWLQQYAKASASERPALLAPGEALASARKKRMVELIRSQTERALEHALRLDQIEQLPQSIRPLVETPFSESAEYVVFPVCPGPRSVQAAREEAVPPGELRFAQGDRLKAFTYGKRGTIASKSGLPVQGIALDGLAAVRDSVFQTLEKEEVQLAGAKFQKAQQGIPRSFATGAAIQGEPIWALAAGRLYAFSDRNELEKLDRALAALDAKPGPRAGSRAIYALPYAPDGSAGFDLAGAQLQASAASEGWTLSKKKLFLIRVDFSDKQGAPVEKQAAEAVLNGQVNLALESMSYGSAGVMAKVSEGLYRMPRDSSFYSGSGRTQNLLDDARDAFRSSQRQGADAAINIGTGSENTGSDYDVVGVSFADIGCSAFGLKFAGFASVGGGDLWMQGSNAAKVYAHEFGHIYGLGHSNFWQTNGDVVGDGSEKEYGDIFDVMGSGDLPEGHFHPQAKQKLSWLASEQWVDATVQGSRVYRLFSIDSNDQRRLVRGLRITKASAQGDAGEYYWIGFRGMNTGHAELTNGACLLWQRPGADRCCLLDTTPQTPGASGDATLAVGRTYADAVAKIYVTPVRAEGTGLDRYLDLQVHHGPFPANRAPSISALDGPSSVTARRSVVFSVASTDPDGDTLAYHWEGGDGSVHGGTAGANASFEHAWIMGGTYTLKVTISDMKGGVASRSLEVRVADPAQDFSARDSGTGADLFGLAANTNLLVAVGESPSASGDGCVIRTSPDGIQWTKRTIADSTLNLKLRAVVWSGARFVAVGTDWDFDRSDWFGVVYTSPDGLAWSRSYRDSTPGTDLRVVAAGNDVVLAGGDKGVLLRSTGSQNFSPIPGPGGTDATQTVSGLAFGSGKFVVASHLRSPSVATGTPVVAESNDNGTTWNNVLAGTGLEPWQDFRAIAYLNGRFIASGWYSKIRTSADGGRTFTTTRSSDEEATVLAHGGGLVFASGIERPPAGSSGSNKPVHLYSMDGNTWRQWELPTTTRNRNAGVFFNARFLIVGAGGQILQTAPVGVESNQSPVLQSLSVQSVKKARSPVSFSVTATDADGDGLTYLWDAGEGTTANGEKTFTHTWKAGGTHKVSVTIQDGRGGSVTRTETVQVSDSLLQSVLRSGAVKGDINGLACNDSVAVAVGETPPSSSSEDAGILPVIQTTNDGTTWQARSVPEWTGNIKLNAATWTGSRFCAVGKDYDQATSKWTAVVYISNAEGSAWERKLKSNVSESSLQAVRSGGGITLAGGEGGMLLRSGDHGQTWTAVSLASDLLPATHTVSSIAYGNSTFVLVAHRYAQGSYNGQAKVLVSVDGLSWTDNSSGANLEPSQDFRTIEFLNGTFVASGFYSKLKGSGDNGATFTTSRTASEQLSGIAYGNGVYFGAGVLLSASGASNTSETNLTLISTDGVQWTRSAALSPDKKALCMVFFKNSFLTGCKSGEIWQSPVDAGGATSLEILTHPASITVREGGDASMEVVAAGAGTLSYQWYRNASAIEGATASTYRISPTGTASTGIYTVRVRSSNGGTILESNPAILSVGAPPQITLQPPTVVSFFGASSGILRMRVAAMPSEMTYELVPVDNSRPLPAVRGKVAANTEEAIINLNGISASGTYKVRFAQTNSSGTGLSADSTPFDIVLRGWDQAAGTYETLLKGETALESSPAQLGTYRGLLVVTITKRGTFSGKLLYNEAPALTTDGVSAPAPGFPRRYEPVSRSFSGTWVDSSTSSLLKVAAPRVGVGSAVGRQTLALELDWSASPPVLNVKVRDFASQQNAFLETGASGCSRVVSVTAGANQAGNFTNLPGRYTIAADPNASSRTEAYCLIQVLPSLRVLWNTRMPGYTGAGSGNLQLSDPQKPFVQFYERSVTSTSTLFSSNSLLGVLAFQGNDGGSWSAGFGASTPAEGLERQTSCLNRRNEFPTVAIHDAAFERGERWSRVETLSFLRGDDARWSGGAFTRVPSFFHPSGQTPPVGSVPAQTLTLRDRVVNGGTVSFTDYSWTLSVSENGTVRVKPDATANQPLLRLRLDKLRGEWIGSFSPVGGLRRNLYGAAVDSGSNSTVIGRGWTEQGSSVPRTVSGGWEIRK